MSTPSTPTPLPGPTAIAVPRDTTTLPPAVAHAGTRGADLFSWHVPAAFGALLVAAVAVWVVRVVRRRRAGLPPPPHRMLRTTAAGAGCLLLAALGGAAAVNTYAGYLPTWSSLYRFATRDTSAHVSSDTTTSSALARTPEGAAALGAHDTSWTVHQVPLDDSALGITGRTGRQVVIATPPGYRSSSQAYPVIYLFGGYPGGPNDWFQSGRVTATVDALVAAGRMPFPLLVEPDINGGFAHDSEGLDAVGGPQVQTWFTRDVVGYVDSHFRTLTDRSHRALAGMSSGGYIALNIALRHPEQFGITLGMEPYGDPGNVTARLLGGSTTLLHEQSPQYYAPSLPMTRQLSVYVDVGSATGDEARVESLARIFSARGLDVVLRLEAGQGHTWAEARDGLPYALAFAASRFGAPVLGQVFPPSAFPTTHRDRFSLLPEDDAQLQHDMLEACRHHSGPCPSARPARERPGPPALGLGLTTLEPANRRRATPAPLATAPSPTPRSGRPR